MPMPNTVQAAGAAEAVRAVGVVHVTAAPVIVAGAVRGIAAGAVQAAGVVHVTAAGAVQAAGMEACSSFGRRLPLSFLPQGSSLHNGQTKLHIMYSFFHHEKEEQHDTFSRFRPPESETGYLFSS